MRKATWLVLIGLLVAGCHSEAPKKEWIGDRLVKASVAGDVAAVKSLLVEVRDPDVQDSSGQTALAVASQARKPEVMKLLIARGATGDPHKHDAASAIGFAALQRDPSVLKAAIEKFQASNTDGRFYWMAATEMCANDAVKPLEALFEYAPQETMRRHSAEMLLNAIVGGRVPEFACLRLLLKHGIDPNAKDRNGMTPLSYAITRGVEPTKILLDAGADPNAKERGRPLISFAGDPKVKALLAKRQAR